MFECPTQTLPKSLDLHGAVCLISLDSAHYLLPYLTYAAPFERMKTNLGRPS